MTSPIADNDSPEDLEIPSNDFMTRWHLWVENLSVSLMTVVFGELERILPGSLKKHHQSLEKIISDRAMINTSVLMMSNGLVGIAGIITQIMLINAFGHDLMGKHACYNFLRRILEYAPLWLTFVFFPSLLTIPFIVIAVLISTLLIVLLQFREVSHKISIRISFHKIFPHALPC